MLDTEELMLKIRTFLKSKPVLAGTILLILYSLYQIHQSIGIGVLVLVMLFQTITLIALIAAVKISGWLAERRGITRIKDQAAICRLPALLFPAYQIFMIYTGYMSEPTSVADIIVFLIFVFLVPIVTEVLISRFVTHRVEKFIYKRNTRVEDLLIATYASVLSMDFDFPKWIIILCSTVTVFEAMQIQHVIQAKVVMRNEQEAEIRD